ncbi:MAG: tetratricopeptide repeat protein, partial [Candidatus Zixiibacteriota bacterium]
TFPDVNLNVGASCVKLGMLDSARYYFEREKLYNPQRVKAYANMASLYLINGQYDSAIAQAQFVLACRPYDVTANIILLRSAYEMQEIDNDSLAFLAAHAAENTGDDVYLLNEAAVMLTQRGALEHAESLLLKALVAKPPPIETDDEAFSPVFRNSSQNWEKQRASAYNQLGYINGLRGNYYEAVRYSSLAIQTDSNLVEAYVNLISGFLSTGQLPKADSVLTIALQKFPTNQHLNQLHEYLEK